MAANRFYSSNAGAMILTAGVNGSELTFIVNVTTGLPTSYPYTLVVDVGTASEEIVSVTAAAGTSLTVTRGQDGTSGQPHGSAATVRHMATARDFREPQEHIGAVSAVHGLTGTVVGTTDSQTLTNKTVSGGTVNPTTLQKGGVNVPTISEAVVITNKDMTSGTNTFPTTLATDAEVTTAVSNHAAVTATHGASGAVVGTTNTQTLTNKTIDGGNNTLQNVPQSAVTSLVANLSTLTSADAALDARLDTLEADTGGLAMAAGTDTVTPVTDVPTSKTVTFPVGRFSAPPNVVVCAISAVPGTIKEMTVQNVNATQFDAVINRSNSTQTGFHWIAMQSG